MAKYDVYKGPEGQDYLLDLQNDTLGQLTTAVVAPLVQASEFQTGFNVLNPKLEVDDEEYVLLPEYMYSIEVRNLKAPIMNLSEKSYEITRALDMLFHGI